MLKISLTQNKFALIDNEDYELISKHNWHLSLGYAVTDTSRKSEKKTTIRMHRLIMNPPKEMHIDHINHNTLDNRKENLRVCTRAENMRNMVKRAAICTSKFKGVTWWKRDNNWKAQIQGKHIGYFDSEIEAAKAYDKNAIKLFGQFSKLNFNCNGS